MVVSPFSDNQWLKSLPNHQNTKKNHLMTYNLQPHPPQSMLMIIQMNQTRCSLFHVRTSMQKTHNGQLFEWSLPTINTTLIVGGRGNMETGSIRCILRAKKFLHCLIRKFPSKSVLAKIFCHWLSEKQETEIMRVLQGKHAVNSWQGATPTYSVSVTLAKANQGVISCFHRTKFDFHQEETKW